MEAKTISIYHSCLQEASRRPGVTVVQVTVPCCGKPLLYAIDKEQSKQSATTCPHCSGALAITSRPDLDAIDIKHGYKEQRHTVSLNTIKSPMAIAMYARDLRLEARR